MISCTVPRPFTRSWGFAWLVNQLINGATKAPQPANQHETTVDKRQPRAFLYSPDCLKGRIFTGAEAIAAAEEDGWVDSPGKAEEAAAEIAAAKAKAKAEEEAAAAKAKQQAPKTDGATKPQAATSDKAAAKK